MRFRTMAVLTGLLFLPGAAGMGAELPAGKEFTNSIGMLFVRIEPGTFTMGSGDEPLPAEILAAQEHGGRKIWLPATGDYDEKPAHRVTITQPFYLGTREVTNRDYERFDPLHIHLRGKKGFSIDNDEAVVFISWHEAQAFCEWLSQKEGLPYRLPTEAEWEYACRAGTRTLFSTGDALPNEYLKNPDNSWYPCISSRNREEVVPLHVGRTPPNPWGLFDMHGNVEEWCLDTYGPYADEDQTDPVGRAEGDFKVTRGGSHGTVAFYLRSANRLGTIPEDQSWFIGFRVALGERPKTPPLPAVPPAAYQLNVEPKIPADVQQGPDPSQPYFRGPRQYVKIPTGSEGPLFSEHNHDPAIAECANGDLLAIWYTTETERGREVAMAASRLRHGEEEWEPASPFWDAPDRNDHAPALWFDGWRTLYHFHGLSAAATWGPLAIVMRTSTDNGVTWSKARLIQPEHQQRNQVIESVIRTKEGYLVLPCDATPGDNLGTALHISRDNGDTWRDAGGSIAGIHAAVAQLKDGRLLAFGRGNTIEGHMPQSVSSDMGKTWTYSPSPFPPIGGGQRLVLLRLREGPLLFISFANENQVPVEIQDAAGNTRTIRGMYAALSRDDGASWTVTRLISEGGPERESQTTNGEPFNLGPVSAEPRGYLSICQGLDGVIHLISSWNHYAFNLKWLETPMPAR